MAESPNVEKADGVTADGVFDEVLDLEEQFYQEGYALGVADGAASGRREGRIFGIERAFERSLAAGELHGRALVWKARFPPQQETSSSRPPAPARDQRVPALDDTSRLRRHVDRLLALTEPSSLPTENSEDAVSEFDDRMKDAKAKAALIYKVVREKETALNESDAADSSGNATLRVRRVEAGRTVRPSGEMEDFAGRLQPRG